MDYSLTTTIEGSSGGAVSYTILHGDCIEQMGVSPALAEQIIMLVDEWRGEAE